MKLSSLEVVKTKGINAVVLTGDEEGNCFSSGYNILDIDESERESGLDPIAASPRHRKMPGTSVGSNQWSCDGRCLRASDGM